MTIGGNPCLVVGNNNQVSSVWKPALVSYLPFLSSPTIHCVLKCEIIILLNSLYEAVGHNIRPKSRMRVTHQLSARAAPLRLLPLTLDHSWTGYARLNLTSLKSQVVTHWDHQNYMHIWFVFQYFYYNSLGLGCSSTFTNSEQ